MQADQAQDDAEIEGLAEDMRILLNGIKTKQRLFDQGEIVFLE